MKLKIALAVLFFSTTQLFAQTNKPSIDDFGIRTGFYFLNAPGGSIMLGKMLPKNLESGIGILFTFNNYSHTTNDTSQAMSTTGSFIPVKSENTVKWFSYAINLSPYLVYHFPIKNNVDVYAGSYISVFAGNTPKNETYNRRYADNYEYKNKATAIQPLSFGVGAGFIVGAEYYVHKNIAVGLTGNLGFTTSMQFGKQTRKTEVVNTGSLNPSQDNRTTETASTLKNIDNSVSLRGGVGFNLTFFFAKHAKEKKV